MREIAAKWVAVLIGLLVVALAAAFAWRENTTRSPLPTAVPAEPPPRIDVDPEVARRGARVFDDAGCARCHAVGGSGNPRSPLDGVGARLTLEEIRARIVAAPSARDGLSRSVIRTKEGYAELPDPDLEALAAWLATLREP